MSADNIESMSNHFKTQYLDAGLVKVLPKMTPLMSGIAFVNQSEKAGSVLEFPVLTSYEHGMTAHGQQGQYTGLEAATVSQNRKAQIKSFPFSGRTAIDFVTANRASGNAQSFMEAISYKVENLQRSFALMLEQMLLSGGVGLGTVASNGEADGTYGGVVFANGISGTKIKIANKAYAEHFWIGSEGMPIEIFSPAGALVVSTVITSYDTDNEWIEVQSLNGVTNLEDHVIYRKGFKDNEGTGLFKIMRQTRASAPLFGIDSATTPLWAVAQFDCQDAPLSFTKVATGVARAKGRGLAEKMTLHVHPQTFANLMPDFNTLKSTGSDFKSRVFSSAGEVKSLEHGTYGIKFFVDGVELTVVSNSLIPKGEAFGIVEDQLRRAGSTDVTYDHPGLESKGKYFSKIPNTILMDLQVYADFTLAPISLNSFIRYHNINNGLPSA